MTERENHGGEQAEYHLSPVEMLEISISWTEGITNELKRELRDVRSWPGSVKTHGGVISRKEREIYHLKARISDLEHLHKSNNAILEKLRNPDKPTFQEE